jgi:protein tyrosine/serine phosphatase
MRIFMHPVRSTSLAILATLAIASGAFAQTLGIDNFAKVNDTYYRGSQPKGQDYVGLHSIGVKTIINLTSDEDALADERQAVEQHGMRYVHIPMSTRRAPTQAELERFFSVVNDPASGPVYVHCVGGRHRTGVMTAIYRMTKDGLSGEQAFKEMKQFKFGPDFLHPEFKKFVYEYQSSKTTLAAAGNHQ